MARGGKTYLSLPLAGSAYRNLLSQRRGLSAAAPCRSFLKGLRTGLDILSIYSRVNVQIKNARKKESGGRPTPPYKICTIFFSSQFFSWKSERVWHKRTEHPLKPARQRLFTDSFLGKRAGPIRQRLLEQHRTCFKRDTFLPEGKRVVTPGSVTSVAGGIKRHEPYTPRDACYDRGVKVYLFLAKLVSE